MHTYMLTMGAVFFALILVAIAKLGAWLIDRREQGATKAIRDAVCVIQASAHLRSLEIEASRRGNLLAAADFADQADQADLDHAIALLDQESRGEGWSS